MPDGPTYTRTIKVPTRGGRIIVHMPTPSQLAAGVQPTIEPVDEPIEVPVEYLDLADEVGHLLAYYGDYAMNWSPESKLGRRVVALRKAFVALNP